MNSPFLRNIQKTMLVPQQITGTFTTSLFDRVGTVGNLGLIVHVGAVSCDADNKLAFTVKHGDATTAASLAAVSSADLVINELPAVAVSTVASKAYRIEYAGDKRYVALVGTETGAVEAMMSVIGIGSVARHAPSDAPTSGTATT